MKDWKGAVALFRLTNNRFGDDKTAGTSVSLNVPKGTNPEATTYQTTLTWELSAVPDN
ncbi:WxL domain-containing protein [Enterococcus casseliflavus]|uniref:WxL domain-containing protein n=1 Tax=Enterococcus casseliflavus TaxID=37734 RepID=UPI0039C8CD58